jgi:2-keto-4-pentenoate hydratase/2-oxohepta-3-ene-1,7-dioic acid hydratase in catechol pathway
MRLVTYRDESGTHIGALREDSVVSLDSVAPSMLALVQGGAEALAAAQAVLDSGAAGKPLAEVELLAPITPPQNIICLGMNYVAHAHESEIAKGRPPSVPANPVYFTKALSALTKPNDDVPLDSKVTSEFDYEVELAYVIGSDAKNVSAGDAMNYVFGYTILNDYSARDVQNRHLQFFKGKSLDRTAPLGPCIVTADEIPDPKVLGLRLRVNGETRQDSSVSDLIFDIPTTLEVLSAGQTVPAGTVISTGTPSGVAMGLNPPVYLKVGDVVEAEIDQIGVIRNTIIAAE